MEALPANTRFSRYHVLSKLGAGGMGEVFLAEDVELERKVALKVLPPALAANDENVRRFIKEAKAASALNHPNILTVYDTGQTDISRFIATEYIKGENLRERFERGHLSVAEILEIAIQVAAALNAAHENGIVHRDVKPENVMLREDGLVKVLDFGLAKLLEKKIQNFEPEATTAKFNTAPGKLMGTIGYMSTEQVRSLETDGRTDVWSLGVMLYEMLTGNRPFTGETVNDVIASILKHEPEPIVANNEEVPAELQRIVRKALQKKRDERYQTMKDLLLDLKNLKREQDFTQELERSQITNKIIINKTESVPPARKSADIHQAVTMTGDDLQTRELSVKPVTGKVGKRNYTILAVSLILIAAFGVIGYFVFSTPPTPEMQINSIAVLPFQNGSGDPNLDYFSDGISESVIDRLTLLPQLKVIARNSSYKFRGQDDLQKAGKVLGARAILTGRVVRNGDQLTVRVELVDTRENRQLWSQLYNRRADDAQAVQAEISREIAERLQLQITGAEKSQFAKSSPVKPEAYELMLKGRFAARQYTPESTQKAVEFYQQAIAQDPKYAHAFAELAYVYRVIGGSGFLDAGETNPKAQSAAVKALELNENVGLAHLVLADIKRDQFDWTAAEEEYKRANQLSPNLAEAHEGYALYLSVLGQHEQAVAEMLRAKELDPLRLQTQISLGAIYYNARRNDEALAALNNALNLDDYAPVAHSWIGIVQASRGAYQKALAAYQQAIKLGDNTTATQCYYGYSLAMSGKRNEAQAVISRLRTGKEFVSPVALAILYTGAGDKERAIEALERGFETRDPQLQYLNVEPHFDALRDDSRFQNLVRKVGLPL